MRLPGVTTGSTFFRPEGTGAKPVAGTLPSLPKISLEQKVSLLSQFVRLFNRCFQLAPKALGPFGWEVLEKFHNTIPLGMKLTLGRAIRQEMNYANERPDVNVSLFPVVHAITELSSKDSAEIVREVGKFPPEQLLEILVGPLAEAACFNKIITYFHCSGRTDELFSVFRKDVSSPQRKALAAVRMAAALFTLGDVENASQLLNKVEYLSAEEFISLKPADIMYLKDAFISLFGTFGKLMPEAFLKTGLELVIAKYQMAGCLMSDDRDMADAGFIYHDYMVDNAGRQMDPQAYSLLRLGSTVRAMYLEPDSAAAIFGKFWSTINGKDLKWRLAFEADRRLSSTELLPKAVLRQLISTGDIDVSLLVAKPAATILPLADNSITIRDVAPQIGITGLPIDREHYDELRDVVILKHGDILPGHNFILGKPESYIDGERELLTINTNPPSRLVPILEQARQMAEAHQGNLVDLAYAIADMVHRNYSRSQGEIVGAVQQTLGGPIAFGGNCRKRSATLQMAYQAAGIPSRRDRGFFMLQENGWHAWVEVAPESPLAFIVDLNVDPRKLGLGQKHEEYNRGKIIPSKYKIDTYPDYPAYEVNGLHYTREGEGAVVWRPKY